MLRASHLTCYNGKGGRAAGLLCLLALASACGDDAASARDLSSADKPSLTFRDGGPKDGGPKDGVPPRDLGDGPLDARSDATPADASADGPAADLLAPDVLPPDITPPDTVAHLCTAFSEFNCSPSSFIVKCSATCTDHLSRKLVILCVGTNCSCQVNGTTKKTCPSGATQCNACQQAFSCCAF